MHKLTLLAASLVSFIAFSGCVTPPSDVDGPADGIPNVVGAAGYGRGFLDVLSGTLTETPETLEVRITVSSLDEADISQRLVAAGFEEGYIGMCWDPVATEGGEYMAECAGVTIRASDTQPIRGAFDVSRPAEEGCNDWWWCAWEVPATVESGAPATITISVPRDLLFDDAVGATLEAPTLVARGYSDAPNEPITGRATTVRACAMGTCLQESVNRQVAMEGDRAGPGTSMTFTTQRAVATVLPAPTTILVDYTHDVVARGHYRADLDIVTVDLQETPQEVAFLVTVASLPNAATHSFDMEIAVDGHTYESWYNLVEGNVRDLGGGHCADFDCTSWVEHEATVEIFPGTPGRIRIAMPWAGLTEANAGSLVTLASVDLGELNVWQGEPTVIDDLTGRTFDAYVNNHGEWDIVYLAKPYYLKVGKA